MRGLVIAAALCALATSVTTADARPARKRAPALALPETGDEVGVAGAAKWPRLAEWLHGAPSTNDADGKIVVHWFCAATKPCREDLARVRKLARNDHVYVVAHVAGKKSDAKKLDPIRGGGHGTVSYGATTIKLAKALKLAGPTTIVVDRDGKAALVATGAGERDARDAKVGELTADIKDYVVSSTTNDAGDKRELVMTVELANGLSYSDKQPAKLTLEPVNGLSCDATELAGDRLHITGKTLTATITCSGEPGEHAVAGELAFGYETTGGSARHGSERAEWKVEVAPPPKKQVAAAAAPAEPAATVEAHAKPHGKPPRVFGLVAFAVPVYVRAEPAGMPPAVTFTPDEKFAAAQAVGLGYVVNKRLSIVASGLFLELLKVDQGQKGWAFGVLSAYASVRLWGGLSFAAGPLMAYRTFFKYDRDYGAYYSLGYRFRLPGKFSMTMAINSPQAYVNKPTYVVAPGISISHGL